MTRFPFADEVRAVLFDLGNTLMCIDHARLAAALGGVGVEAEVEAVRRAEYRARPRLDPILAKAARREGREILDAVTTLFLEELRPGLERNAAARSTIAVGWPTFWSSVPADASSTLDVLRRDGIRVGVVSNTSDGRAGERLTSAGLRDRFEFVVDLHQVGIEKPDPRIFALAVAKLALRPSQCVYVGDLFSVDVVGARAAGLHALLIDPMEVWTHVDALRVTSLAEVASGLAVRGG